MNQPSPIERIPSRAAELGEGLQIHRALPSRQRRMVGAWCFADHVGPVRFAEGQEMHVGAHPHTCLQTFTWMIEGEMLHRDSLGSDLVIRPGQVNLMTAGRGIVHTEDSLPGQRSLHAAQLWIALPPEAADIEPAFEHYPVLPQWEQQGLQYSLLAGEWDGRNAPTRVHTPLLGLDMFSPEGGSVAWALRADFEYAVLVLQGRVELDGDSFVADEFAFLGQGRTQLPLKAAADSRLLLLGGEPWREPALMWWNFVGHSKAAVTQAQADWESGNARFGAVKGDGGRRLTAPRLPW